MCPPRVKFLVNMAYVFKSQGRIEGVPSSCKVPGQYGLCLSHKAGWKVCPPGVKFLVNMICV